MDESKREPREWQWTFEGANNPTSNVQNPEPNWNRTGTYDVMLRATRPAFEGETARSTEKIFKDAITILPGWEPLPLKNLHINEIGDRLRLEFNREITTPDIAEFDLSVEGNPIQISRIVQPLENNYTILDIYLQESLDNLSRLTVESTQNIFTFDDQSPLEERITETKLFFVQELNLFPAGYGNMEPSKIAPESGDADILDSQAGGGDAYWNTEPGNVTELSQDAFLGEYSLVWLARKTDSRGRSPYIPLEQGKNYRIIFYAKTDEDNAAIDALVLTENNDANPSQLLSAPVSIDWTKFEFIITAEESLGHYIRTVNSKGADNVRFWIDETNVFEK